MKKKELKNLQLLVVASVFTLYSAANTKIVTENRQKIITTYSYSWITSFWSPHKSKKKDKKSCSMCNSSLDYKIWVLWILYPLKSQGYCSEQLWGSSNCWCPSNFSPSSNGWLWMAVDLFNVATNKISQENEVANFKCSRLACFMKTKILDTPSSTELCK